MRNTYMERERERERSPTHRGWMWQSWGCCRDGASLSLLLWLRLELVSGIFRHKEQLHFLFSYFISTSSRRNKVCIPHCIWYSRALMRPRSFTVLNLQGFHKMHIIRNGRKKSWMCFHLMDWICILGHPLDFICCFQQCIIVFLDNSLLSWW